MEQIGKLKETENSFVRNMPIVACKCGENLLVIPDLMVMGEAIKKHLKEHLECDEEFLTQEIIKALSKLISQA